MNRIVESFKDKLIVAVCAAAGILIRADCFSAEAIQCGVNAGRESLRSRYSYYASYENNQLVCSCGL